MLENLLYSFWKINSTSSACTIRIFLDNNFYFVIRKTFLFFATTLIIVVTIKKGYNIILLDRSRLTNIWYTLLSWRCSTLRDSWLSAIAGTFNSLAKIFNWREISDLLLTVFSACSCDQLGSQDYNPRLPVSWDNFLARDRISVIRIPDCVIDIDACFSQDSLEQWCTYAILPQSVVLYGWNEIYWSFGSQHTVDQTLCPPSRERKYNSLVNLVYFEQYSGKKQFATAGRAARIINSPLVQTRFVI